MAEIVKGMNLPPLAPKSSAAPATIVVPSSPEIPAAKRPRMECNVIECEEIGKFWCYNAACIKTGVFWCFQHSKHRSHMNMQFRSPIEQTIESGFFVVDDEQPLAV